MDKRHNVELNLLSRIDSQPGRNKRIDAYGVPANGTVGKATLETTVETKRLPLRPPLKGAVSTKSHE